MGWGGWGGGVPVSHPGFQLIIRANTIRAAQTNEDKKTDNWTRRKGEADKEAEAAYRWAVLVN